jgi:hypothetical protein
MREFADLPPKARQLMVANVMKAHHLLIDNLAAARGDGDDNDSLAGLIITFFCGICVEQNLGPDRTRTTKKIKADAVLLTHLERSTVQRVMTEVQLTHGRACENSWDAECDGRYSLHLRLVPVHPVPCPCPQWRPQ